MEDWSSCCPFECVEVDADAGFVGGAFAGANGFEVVSSYLCVDVDFGELEFELFSLGHGAPLGLVLF